MFHFNGISLKFHQIIEIAFLAYKMLPKITYIFLSKLLKIDENDENVYINIFQRTIDVIVNVFVGCYIPLGPPLAQISWL